MTEVEVRARVTVMNDFPIMAWRDEPVRPHLWGMLRDRAAEVAKAERGWVLTDDPEDRSPPQYRKFMENSEGDLVLWPCPEEEAEMVALRMSVWSAPRG